MKKRIKVKHDKTLLWIITFIFIFIVIIIGGFYNKNSYNNSPYNNEITQDILVVSFPYELEGGKLTIDSMFQYTGFNPDCDDKECENVGSIQLTNTSGEYLKFAAITVTLENGTNFTFHIEDIKAGGVVYAFDTQNQFYEANSSVKDITVDTEYASSTSLLEDSLSLQVEDTSIYIENISGKSLSDLTVVYHCSIDSIIFGGLSYQRHIESLSSGESTVFDAVECYIGGAEVSCIYN